MWALRRASTTSLRAQGSNIATFRVCTGLGSLKNHTEDNSSSSEHPEFDRWLTYKTCYRGHEVPNWFTVGSRSFSSQAGAKSGGEEDDIEDGFSELETPEASETTAVSDIDDDTTSDSASESSDDEENLEEAIETDLIADTGIEGDKSKKKKPNSALFGVILSEQGPSIDDALDKYVADGKDFSRSEIYGILLGLRRFKLFGKALQLSEWVEKNKKLDFEERDYATRLDLIAKVRGLQRAESYIEKIPKSHRVEVVYRTLLANCVIMSNVKKAEEVFNKMKELGFPLSAFTCNQMLLLYKRTDKKKIADVLLMMEKENLKPSIFTYQVLIDAKGQVNDISGMDQIVETMKAEGIEPNTRLLATLARHYAYAGLKEKAESVLKQMEGSGDLKDNRWMCPIMLPIYAVLGEADEVERVWKVCEENPKEQEYLATIEAWGKLKNVEKAESIFNKLSTSREKLSSRHYSSLLKVYAANKMLNKGKELLKQMGDSNCYIGPIIWDLLVKLYVDSGEVEKADSILQKAIKQNPQSQQSQRPLFNSYMTILDQYAKRGDIHNSEKMFQRMRQAGYVSRARPVHALLHAYIKAKAPAYGIRERLKADNIFPNKALAAQLTQVDAFKKSAVSDLLD